MILILHAENRRKYADVLLQHYRIRHDVYVGERKWMKLARADGLERDQFDNDNALYVLAMEDDKVVGGSRLIPTLKPHLLSEVFPYLANVRGLPRAHDIYEWTRVHVVKDRREGRNGGPIAGSIYCGILEFCLAQGISSLTALVEMWWLPRFHEMGWELRPLGLPELIEGEWSIAVELPIRHEILVSTREFFGFSSASLMPLEIFSPREELSLS